MCWQDWKIGAQLRQVRVLDTNNSAGFGSFDLPPNNRRMGIVLHGPIHVTIRQQQTPTDPYRPIVAKAGITGDPGDVWPNIALRSTVLSVAEFGNDLRGGLTIGWQSPLADQVAEISELIWCGPESLDGGL